LSAVINRNFAKHDCAGYLVRFRIPSLRRRKLADGLCGDNTWCITQCAAAPRSGRWINLCTKARLPRTHDGVRADSITGPATLIAIEVQQANYLVQQENGLPLIGMRSVGKGGIASGKVMLRKPMNPSIFGEV